MAGRGPDGDRALIDRLVAAHRAQDWTALASLLHPDYVEEWPQSGERIRGAANVCAILGHYPGGLPDTGVGTRRVSGAEEDTWVAVSAGFGYQVVRVTAAGDTFTFEGTAKYADGTTTYVVALVQVRDGKIWRQTTYFAPPFEAPAWRAQFVEPMQSVQATSG